MFHLVPNSFLRIRNGVRRSTLVLLLAVAAFVGLAMLTIPWTATWHDVQPLSLAREGPSFWPRVAESVYQPTSPAGRALQFASSWVGHDDLGRSLLFRLLPATLVSLAIGLAGAAMATIVGVGWGALAGLCGGTVDRMMMRVVDVLYGLPYILTVILLKIALTRPLTSLFAGQGQLAGLVVLLVAIGGVSWLTMARVVRGQVLTLRTRGYVEAARCSGAGTLYVLRRHLFPNMLGPILAYSALVVPQAMVQEAFLSFLGIGVPPPIPSLGRLAADGVEAVNTFVGYWWLILFPCGALFGILLALNLAADALRDRFDPKATLSTQ